MKQEDPETIEPATVTLEDLRLFDFRTARGRAETLFEEVGRERDLVYELVLLSAAELTILSIVLEKGTPRLLPLEEPLRVSNLAVDAAFVKTDCLPVGCLDPTPVDATLFTGDLNKLGLLDVFAGPEDEVYWDGFDARVRQLDDKYQRRGKTMAELSERGLVRLGGVLWKAKLGTIWQKADLAKALRDYAGEFELTTSIGEQLARGWHALALAREAAGDVDEAERYFKLALDRLTEDGQWREAAQVARQWAQLLRRLDRTSEAFKLMDQGEVLTARSIGGEAIRG